MTVHLLQQVMDIVVDHLAALINNCLKCGIFPVVLKWARIVQIYKKGDPDLNFGYRLISILIDFGKMFEAVVKV